LELVPYDDFARLRMGEFWPDPSAIRDDADVECCMGLGSGQRVGFCSFLDPRHDPGRVCEVRLEAFGPADCPDDVARAILGRIGLPLGPGMTRAEAVALLGEPVRGSAIPADGVEFLHFVVGGRWRYRVPCTFRADRLVGVIVVRADRYRDRSRA
jgi:hypothetical protein